MPSGGGVSAITSAPPTEVRPPNTRDEGREEQEHRGDHGAGRDAARHPAALGSAARRVHANREHEGEHDRRGGGAAAQVDAAIAAAVAKQQAGAPAAAPVDPT